MKYPKIFPALLSAGTLCSRPRVPLFVPNRLNSEVPLLTDIHLQDIYEDLQSENVQMAINPRNGNLGAIRRIGSPLNSTRLFNEIYFAMLAALQDVREKRIKLIVLPGDYTDDGCPSVEKKSSGAFGSTWDAIFHYHGKSHPVSPFGGPARETDFLGENGQNQSAPSDPAVVLPDTSYLVEPVGDFGC